MAMPSHTAQRWVPLLLLCAGACVLQAPDMGPLAELRARQRAQADRVAAALCQGYYGCGCQAMYSEHTSEAECREQVSTTLVQRLEQGIDGELDYDPRCLDAHAELFEGLACAIDDGLFLDAALTRLLDEASYCRTYQGERELDQDCEVLITARGDECGPELACDPVFGLCVDTTPLPEGTPCDASGDGPRCAPDLSCDWSSAQDLTICIRPAPLGASCAAIGYCEGNGWCDPSDSICRSLPEVGQPCLALDGLPPAAGCAWGLRCDAGVCTSTAEGNACYVSCESGLRCEEGTCVPGRPIVCDAQAWLP
jgi:hypothetical protein